MSAPKGLRERKKLDTKRAIADVATRLFMKRGFDAVTVGDIAAEANVAKMTVFNYFRRKEDLFFDREDETRQIIRNALAGRRRGLSPAGAMRDLAQQFIKQEHPFATFTASSARYWQTVAESAVLLARVRETRDEVSKEIASMLAESVRQSSPDAEARLFASLLVASLTAAHAEALRLHGKGRTSNTAQKVFLDIFDRGIAGIVAALKGTPYV